MIIMNKESSLFKLIFLRPQNQYIVLILALFITSCATPPKDNNAGLDQAKAYKIAIVNASGETINAIKYKPCKSTTTRYQYLTGNLHPAEKFTINIYSRCVDLLATNAFKKKLVDVKNVDLKSIKTWTIK